MVIQFFKLLNESVIFYCLFPSILLIGLFLTWKLRFLQIRGLKKSLSFLLNIPSKNVQKNSYEGTVSRLASIASVLAGNFGTGTISGVAVSLVMGGPGSLVWMWVASFFCAIVQYAGSFLAVKHRRALSFGGFVGGPMVYLQKQGKTGLSFIFCIFTLASAFTTGNILQVNAIALAFPSFPFSKIILGLSLILPVSLVIVKGAKKIANFSVKVVPFISIFYLIACCFVLFINYEAIWPSCKLVFSSAFKIRSTFGGICGFSLAQVISTGISRAIMATDGGTGFVSILQSNSKSSNPVIDGIVTLLPPFIVMIVCSLTGLTLLASSAYKENLFSTSMILYAFTSSLGNKIGFILIFSSILLFAYTTILAWFACAESIIFFFTEKKFFNLLLKFFFLLTLPLGAVINSNFIWLLSDFAYIGMILINLIVIIGGIKEVMRSAYLDLSGLTESYSPSVSKK